MIVYVLVLLASIAVLLLSHPKWPFPGMFWLGLYCGVYFSLAIWSLFQIARPFIVDFLIH